MDFSSN